MTERNEGELIREYLAKYPWRCDVCGYQLGGLREARCPECGGEIRIGRRLLGPPQPVPWWCWLVAGWDGVVCLFAGLLVGGILNLVAALVLASILMMPTLAWVALWLKTSRDPKDRAVNKVVLPIIAAGTTALAVLVVVNG